MQDADGNLIGGFKIEQAGEGGLGWTTGCIGSRDLARVTTWVDVCQIYEAAPGAGTEDWKGLISPGKVPAGLIGDGLGTYRQAGSVRGGVGGDYGGADHDRLYLIIQDRVIRRDGDGDFADTVITGLPVESNGQRRHYGPKFLTHPTDKNVFFASMGTAGVRYFTNGGLTGSALTVTNLPAPIGSDPDTIMVRDPADATKVYFAVSGVGIFASTNGGASVTNITGSSGIEYAANMVVINGVLYVSKVAANTVDSNNNIYKWNGSAWSNLTLGYGFVHIVPDPRYAVTGGFWLFRGNGSYAHTQNGADFIFVIGSLYWHPLQQMQSNTRELIRRKYQDVNGGPALSLPRIIGDWMYFPGGYGISKTYVPDFPNVHFGNPAYQDAFTPNLPVLIEASGGELEALVGQTAGWGVEDGEWVAYGSGQDVQLQRLEFGARGQRATVEVWPSNTLSHGHGLTHGPDPSFVVSHATGHQAAGGGAGQISYRTAAHGWRFMENQPNIGGVFNHAGLAAAGPDGKVVATFTVAGVLPQFVNGYGLGSNTWAPLVCRDLEGDLMDLAGVYAGGGRHGFHGEQYYIAHHNVAHDHDNPGDFYLVNIGASAGSDNWVPDSLGWGGLYKVSAAEPGVARQIRRGTLTPFGNYAYYDCKLLIMDGYAVFMSNYLSGTPLAQNNKVALYELATGTLTYINDVVNCQWIDAGAPFPGSNTGEKCLWLLGWAAGSTDASGFGLFFKRSLSSPAEGPYPVVPKGGGWIHTFAAHPAKWGVSIAALSSRGHARIEYDPRLV